METEEGIKLAAFNPETRCPKCGCDNLSHLHRSKGDKMDYDERPDRIQAHGYAKAEHIRSHCKRCHFEWYSAPLDSTPNQSGYGTTK